MTPLLYHGTSSHRARSILKHGFRRARSAFYTGTAVNLTESVCLAWEYGPQRGGKILAAELDPDTRWQEAARLPVGQSYDPIFSSGAIDALRTYGGNVWLLWTMERARVRVLSLPEIMSRLVAELRQDGPDCSYNGDVGPLATLFWRGEDAAYAELRICAPPGFDVSAWKTRTLARYVILLALARVRPGDGQVSLARSG
jgi:hypothetical protein